MSVESIVAQMRVFLDQIEGIAPGPVSVTKKPLPHAADPRPSMPLSADGKMFTGDWWMEGYCAAMAGTRLVDWAGINFGIMGIGGQNTIPKHFTVLPPNVGQASISVADIGWIDSSWYNPADYPDDTACIAAFNKAGRPTFGPGGKFTVNGRYMPTDPRFSPNAPASGG
jgi:hypothetical protein